MAKVAEVVLKAKGLKELADQASKLAGGMKEAADEAAELNEELEQTSEESQSIGKEGGKGMKALSKGLKLGKAGFQALGKAIIATGVGALVALLGGLIAKLMENKKVMEVVEQATAGLGAVFQVIIDLLQPLGDLLISAFTNPQEALDKLQEKFDKVSDWFSSLYDFIQAKFMVRWNKLLVGIKEAQLAWSQFTGDKEGVAELANEIGDLKREIDDFEQQARDAAVAIAEPFVELANTIGEVAEKAKQAAMAAVDLKKRQQALADAQRRLNVEYANERAEIEQLKKTRDDERLSLEERAEAARHAAELDKEFADRRVAQAQAQADLIRQEIALQGESVERLDALAEAEIAIADARAESAAIQTEQMTSLYGLEQEAIAQAQEYAAMEREFALERQTEREQELQGLRNQLTERLQAIDLLKVSEEEKEALRVQARENADELIRKAEEAFREEDAVQREADMETLNQTLLTEEELELMALKTKYDKLFELADKYGMDTTALTAKYEKERAKVEEKATQESIARTKARADQAVGIFQASLDLFQAMQTEADEDDVEAQRAGFERAKKVQLAGAAISTASAVIASLSAPPVGLGYPAGLPGAIQAGITGAAQMATINKQKFQEPEPETPEATEAPATAPSLPELDFGETIEAVIPDSIAGGATSPTGEATPPLQAYVVSTEVTSQQELDAQLAHQSTL